MLRICGEVAHRRWRGAAVAIEPAIYANPITPPTSRRTGATVRGKVARRRRQSRRAIVDNTPSSRHHDITVDSIRTETD
jgi:hypothetical protein